MKYNKDFIFSFLATLTHYYDYHLFASLAAQLGAEFIRGTNSTSQLMSMYSLIAISYLVRPLASYVMGRMGDVYGRYVTTVFSLLMTSFSTLIIAVLPSYSSIGITATVVLILVRVSVAGLNSSGTDGIRVYVYEKFGANRKNFSIGVITSAGVLGSMLCAFSAFVFTLDYFPEYAWRASFLVGGIMNLVMLVVYILYMPKENYLKKEKEHDLYSKSSTLSIISNNMRVFICAIILAGSSGSIFHFYSMFMTTYLFKVIHIVDQSHMRFYGVLGTGIYAIFAAISGVLYDKFIKNKLMIMTASAITVVVLNIMQGIFLYHHSFSICLYLVQAVFIPFITINALSLMKGSMKPVFRYRVFSLAHAVGSIIISSPTYYVSMLLYSTTKLNFMPLIYFCVVILLSIFAAFCVRDNHEIAIESKL
jgi:MHS family proline/betaine transporter-like MFS transporter